MPSKRAGSVVVGWEDLSEEYGLWCDRCFLPGVFEFAGAVTFDGKPDIIYRHRECVDCGYVFTPKDDPQ
jgi:hypothetical protein